MSEMEEYSGLMANKAKAHIEDNSPAATEGATVSPPAYTVVPQMETAAVPVHTYQPQPSRQGRDPAEDRRQREVSVASFSLSSVVCAALRSRWPYLFRLFCIQGRYEIIDIIWLTCISNIQKINFFAWVCYFGVLNKCFFASIYTLTCFDQPILHAGA